MNLLKVSIIFFLIILIVFNTHSEEAGSSEELNQSLNSNKRAVARKLLHQSNTILNLLRNELRIYRETIDLPEMNDIIEQGISSVIKLFNTMLSTFHMSNEVTSAELKDKYKDIYDWTEVENNSNKHKWELLRKSLHRLSTILTYMEDATRMFEIKLLQSPNERRKRHIVERLENLLYMQKTFYMGIWTLKKIFRQTGFDPATHTWNDGAGPVFTSGELSYEGEANSGESDNESIEEENNSNKEIEDTNDENVIVINLKITL